MSGLVGQVGARAGVVGSTTDSTQLDFEQGTWTPGITGATLFGTPSGAPSGTYTKVGNVVSVFATFTNVEITSVSGYAYITGLPFNTTATSAGHTAHNNMSTVSQFLISGSGALATADNSLGTTNAWHAGSGKYLNFQATYQTS